MRVASALAPKVGRPFVCTLLRRWGSSGGPPAASSTPPPPRPPRPSYRHQPGREALSGLTLGQVAARAARQWPQREAIVSVHQQLRLTFSEVMHQADHLAAALCRIGLRPGDRLGLCAPNSVEWYITNLAAARAGLIFVNINPAYQEKEIEYCLSKVGVKTLVVPEKFKTQNYLEMIQNIDSNILSCPAGQIASNKLPHLSSIITLGKTDFPCAFAYEDLLQQQQPTADAAPVQSPVQPDDGCNLQFTSGTTGRPKGTLLSHHSVVNNAYFTARRLGFDQKHHRICLQVPFFHCFGNVLGIVLALHCGSTLVLPSFTFNAADSIAAITQESCTLIYGTPTMYIDVLSKSEELAVKEFPSLESAVVAGSPCPPNLFRNIASTFGLHSCYGVYGMTETSPLTFVPDAGDSVERCAHSVGRVLDHCEVKVVDPRGRLVDEGQAGELLVRGFPNMLGYYGDEEKTKEIVGADRWLRTGDQFVLDPDGYGRVVGRLKDLIIRGGENIYPREVEDLLMAHDGVQDAQVIGVPDDRFGEEVCACIRTKPGSEVTAAQLRSFCKGKVAHFKIPKYFTFLSEYPRTQSGKVQKFKLQQIVLEEGLLDESSR